MSGNKINNTNPQVEIWGDKYIDDSIWDMETEDLVIYIKQLFDIGKEGSTPVKSNERTIFKTYNLHR